ncbi:hypothetical protein K402DRAFT_408187 [Aulographum hederae CBS 113979]|uniref:Uncharacterized protein n=1 Tax=Aulographum hederae CBS 113979 TaxID=1176131 RepID=A0A6G1GLA8_9PEZI|nr:hypothetical protein K402DRAFT_408187 [Aulographum hederae CBS 113979]
MAAQQVAWIGLGNMGRGMCENIVRKGLLVNPIILHNRTRARSEALSAKLGGPKNAVISDTIQEAVAESNIIFTCVVDDNAIKQTITTALQHDVRGKLFVDCTTVHPDTTSLLSDQVTAAGASFVACPVFGAPAMADAGKLVCVVAGPGPAVAQTLPFTTNVISRATIDFSDQPPNRATLLKVTGNMLTLSMVESLSEALTVAEKSGLGVDNMHTFISTMFSGPYALYSERMRSGDYYHRDEPLVAVGLGHKDAGYALGIARENGASMPAVEVAVRHLDEVVGHCGKKGDIAGIYGAVREEAGLKFENGR